MTAKYFSLVIALCCFVCLAESQKGIETPSPKERFWNVDAGISFLHSKEQLKNRETGQSGGALFTHSNLALFLRGAYQVHRNIDLGIFGHFEFGKKAMAGYAGVDANGTPQPGGGLSGHYSHIWIGPSISFCYRHFFLEFHHALLGFLRSSVRNDTPSASGNTTDAFRAGFFPALIIMPGIQLKLSDRFVASLRIEYRYLYYKTRGSEDIANNLELGNQSIRPVLGVRLLL